MCIPDSKWRTLDAAEFVPREGVSSMLLGELAGVSLQLMLGVGETDGGGTLSSQAFRIYLGEDLRASLSRFRLYHEVMKGQLLRTETLLRLLLLPTD